jgi:hypothetical protein
VDRSAPLDDFAAIADQIPVFRVRHLKRRRVPPPRTSVMGRR